MQRRTLRRTLLVFYATTRSRTRRGTPTTPAGGRSASSSTAPGSSHLRKLTEAGLLAVEAHGRHRYYRLATPHVAQLIEALQQLAPTQPIRSLRQSTRAASLRRARTCYDHLAGRLGVEIMTSMIDSGHLSGDNGTYDPDLALRDRRSGYGHDADYGLTAAGHDAIAELGVRLSRRRPMVRYCVDWSEQRHHLAGALGRGILDRLTELDWVRRNPNNRSVTITTAGRQGLHTTFAITTDGSV